MAIQLLPIPRFRFTTNTGAPAVGYKVYTYQPGTSTPKATYTDYTGGTANDNPVILDARGEAEIWFDGIYKIIIKDSNDVTIYTQDNYGEGTNPVLQGNFNLAKNGSFETDANGDGEPDDWTIVEYTDSGGVSRDSTEQIHGQYSLKFISTGSGGGHATTDYFEVQEARSVPVGFAIQSSVVDVHNQVDVVWYTAAKAVISTTTVYDDAATNPTSWEFKAFTATPPTNARFARVRLFGCKDDDATTGTTWFDNVQVEAVTAIAGFFPNVDANVTASDEELNLLDGVTASTEELNKLDGLTPSTSDLNTLAAKTIKTLTKDHGSKSADYTLDLSEADAHLVEFSATATLTINSSFSEDKAVVVVKTGGNTVTLAGIDNNSPTLTASVSVQDFLGLVKSFGKITCVATVLNEATV